MMRFAVAIAGALLASSAFAEDPFARALGGPFELVNQFGETRTQVDPDGQAQLVFFGYANCPDICTAALPLMAQMIDTLEDDGHIVRPIMITVDPKFDTPENMGPAMAKWHERFIGLTGSEEALQVSYDAFKVEFEPIFTDPAGQTIYSHGSFIYMLDPNGEFLTLLPPTLGPDEAAKIVASYLDASS